MKKRKLIIVTAVLSLAAAALFVQVYRTNQATERLTRYANETTAYFTNVTRHAKNSDNITMIELIDKVSKSIDYIDKVIVNIKSTCSNDERAAFILDYAQKCQSTLRTFQNIYETILDGQKLVAKIHIYENELQTVDNEFTKSWLLEQKKDALDEAVQMPKAILRLVHDHNTSVDDLKVSIFNAQDIVGTSALIDNETLVNITLDKKKWRNKLDF